MDALSRLTAIFLLNALWQIALVTAVAMLLDRWLRGAPARYRHLLWTITLAAAIALPLASARWTRDTTAAQLTSAAANRDLGPIPMPPARRSQVAVRVSPAMSARAFLRRAVAGAHPAVRIPRTPARDVLVLYAAFLMIMLVRLVRAWLRTREIRGNVSLAQGSPLATRHSPLVRTLAAAADRAGASILWSSQVPGPVTVGARHPKIILPSRLLDPAAEDDLKAALAHELAHVRRRDYLCNLICEALLLPVAFHPLASIIKRRLSELRELACDELAASALNPASYARSLVRMAHQISGLPLPPRSRPDYTLGVFDADILEERVMRLLKPRASMRLAKCSLFTAALVIAAFCVAAAAFSMAPAQSSQTGETNPISPAPVGAVAGAVTGGVEGGVVGGVVAGIPGTVQDGAGRAISGGVSGGVVGGVPMAGTFKYAGKVYAYAGQASEAKTGSLTGIVVDDSGARIPKAEVKLVSRNTSFQQSVETDDTGNFSFDEVPAGRYTLEVTSSGMGAAVRSFQFKAEGQSPFFPFVLHPGDVTESAVVTAQGPANESKPTALGPHKLRIGGSVAAAKLIAGTHVSPEYPESARAKGIEGLVTLEATISADGVPTDIKVISSPDDSLTTAATDAVKQWRYQPTLLNGEPVEVVTTIAVDFRLQN
jgi:TonB family protein